MQRSRPLRLRWLEAQFFSEKVDAHARLSATTRVPIATGDHFYGRWEMQHFLQADAVRVVQADPEWCGGVSEFKKICTLASIYGAPVIHYGHNLHAAVYVVAGESPSTCPLSEFLVLKMALHHHFDANRLIPKEGRITLSDRPGFGMALSKAKIEECKLLSWSL